MPEIIVGAFLLSIVHAAIPNHWLPLVAVSRSENWHMPETIGITAITGVAHTLSTILIGLFIGWLGFELASRFETVASVAAPLVLAAMGAYYILSDFRKNRHHHHHHASIDTKEHAKKTTLIATLALAMFLSPCIEIEAYYFHAGTHGWIGVLTVSLVYLVITVGGMMLLVGLGTAGARKFRFHFLEHNEGLLTGLILLAAGAFAYFVNP